MWSVANFNATWRVISGSFKGKFYTNPNEQSSFLSLLKSMVKRCKFNFNFNSIENSSAKSDVYVCTRLYLIIVVPLHSYMAFPTTIVIYFDNQIPRVNERERERKREWKKRTIDVGITMIIANASLWMCQWSTFFITQNWCNQKQNFHIAFHQIFTKFVSINI